MKVSDVMTSKVMSVSPEASIVDAIQLMLKKHISGLPVIDQDGRLVGIVSEGDFLRRPETGADHVVRQLKEHGDLLHFERGSRDGERADEIPSDTRRRGNITCSLWPLQHSKQGPEEASFPRPNRLHARFWRSG
jgi:CBS domain